MPRRFYFRDDDLELDGFVSGESKSYAFDQAINNQSPTVVKPITFFGGDLAPRSLTPDRGHLAEESSLSVNPPDSGSHDDTNENWRGFLTHFVTPPLAAQRLRAGFLKLGLKMSHASASSVVVGEFSVYVVDSDGGVVSFLHDIDRGVTLALASTLSIHRIGVPCMGANIPSGGRLVVEVWFRETVTGSTGTEGVGADFALGGGDDSLASSSPASWAEFAQPLLLLDEQPVFSARIDPLVGVRHHKIFATDVIEHEDTSEQRTKLRSTPNEVMEMTAVGYGEQEMQQLDALLEKLSDRDLWLPWWRDEQTLPVSLGIGDDSAAIATEGYGFIQGERAIIYRDPFNWEVVTIETLADGVLTFAAGVTRAWPARTASILPLKDVVVLGSLALKRVIANTAEVNLAFQATSAQAGADAIDGGGGGGGSGDTPVIALIHESTDVRFYSATLDLIATTPAFTPDERWGGDPEKAVALCWTQRGTVWVAYIASTTYEDHEGDSKPGITIFRELDPATASVIRAVTTLFPVCEDLQGFHQIAELAAGDVGGGLAIGSDPKKFKTTSMATYVIDGVTYTKPPTDNLIFSAPHVVSATKYGAILIQADAAGVVTTVVSESPQDYDSAEFALSQLPPPDSGNGMIGQILIHAGAVDWTANSSNMTDGGDVVAAVFSNATRPLIVNWQGELWPILMPAGTNDSGHGEYIDAPNGRDFALNAAGTFIVQMDDADLLLFDLAGGAPSIIHSFTDEEDNDLNGYWPCWLSDNSVLVLVPPMMNPGEDQFQPEGYRGNGKIHRLNMAGEIIQTYEYDPSVFPQTYDEFGEPELDGGLRGMGASIAENRLWLYGEAAGVPKILPIDLTTGESLEVVTLGTTMDSDDTASGFVVRDEFAEYVGG